VKATGATFLLPVAWGWLARRLGRRWGRGRAWATVAVGAACGRGTLAWVDVLRQLRVASP
jgi:hypothetical protein